MKQITFSIIAILIVWFTYYLLGSLVSWDFNPGHWHLVVRVLVAIVSFISFIRFLKSLVKLV